MTKKMTTIEKAIYNFQCAGCVCGSSPKTCDKFQLSSHENNEGHCANHVPGTLMYPGGRMILGMPTGFDKIRGADQKEFINIYEKGSIPEFDFLNLPVWAMEHEGNLFVKVVCARILSIFTYIILGGKMDDLGEYKDKVVDVKTVLDKID